MISLLLTGIACICSGAVQWTGQCKYIVWTKVLYLLLLNVLWLDTLLHTNVALPKP